MKGAIFFVIIAGIGVTAFAAQDTIDVANIDKDVRHEMLKSAAPQPRVTEKYEYYDITGNNANEMRRQMSQNGIKWDDGKTYDALTTWNVQWDYGYKQTEKGCSVDSFAATVDVTFRFPKWLSSSSSPEPLVKRWNTYMTNLVTHENGHRNMAVQEAADFSRAVSELAAPTCAELDQKVEDLGRDRMAKLNTDERDYDATTIHGTTQGAVFP